MVLQPMNELEKRIKKSRDVMVSYPEWVKRSMVFHGGGVTREKPEPPQ